MGWFSKYKYLFLIVFVVAAIIGVSVVVTLNHKSEKVIANPGLIYNTWKVEKLYKNGKLVINSSKYNNLFFQVNRDGTAEWIKGAKRIKLSAVIAPDGSQIILDNGITLEEVETIFELRPHVLRMGKRSMNDHYEYVMTSVEMKGGNFF